MRALEIQSTEGRVRSTDGEGSHYGVEHLAHVPTLVEDVKAADATGREQIGRPGSACLSLLMLMVPLPSSP